MTIQEILDSVKDWNNYTFTSPNPNASDEVLMKLYANAMNPEYVNADALRDVELGVQEAASKRPLPYFMLDRLRNEALKSRGMHWTQDYGDVPAKSRTGAPLQQLMKMPVYGSNIGA